MIGEKNGMLQVTLPKNTIKEMDVVCEAFSKKFGFKVTKSMLVKFMFGKLIGEMIQNQNEQKEAVEAKEDK